MVHKDSMLRSSDDMKTGHALTMTAAVAMLLCSCGTQIEMMETVPAKVSFGRGTPIVVNSPAHDYGLRREMREHIQSNGFYKLADNATPASACMNFRNVILKKDLPKNKEQRPSARLLATVEVMHNQHTEFFKSFNENVPIDQQGVEHVDRACHHIAASIMSDITPHDVCFSVWVKGNKENPAIEQGAEACSRGDLDRAECLAHEALKVNPQEPEAFYLLGVVERRRLNFDKSSAYFRKANALAPSSKYSSAIDKNRDMLNNARKVKQQMEGH